MGISQLERLANQVKNAGIREVRRETNQFRRSLVGQARQLVRHGIFTLNGRKVNIPSLQVRVGDTVEVPEKNRKIPVIAEAQEVLARRGCPSWLEADGAAFKGTVKALPQRDDIQFPVNEQLIVELYSK